VFADVGLLEAVGEEAELGGAGGTAELSVVVDLHIL
jgi:hypothetical protein